MAHQTATKKAPRAKAIQVGHLLINSRIPYSLLQRGRVQKYEPKSQQFGSIEATFRNLTILKSDVSAKPVQPYSENQIEQFQEEQLMQQIIRQLQMQTQMMLPQQNQEQIILQNMHKMSQKQENWNQNQNTVDWKQTEEQIEEQDHGRQAVMNFEPKQAEINSVGQEDVNHLDWQDDHDAVIQLDQMEDNWLWQEIEDPSQSQEQEVATLQEQVHCLDQGGLQAMPRSMEGAWSLVLEQEQEVGDPTFEAMLEQLKDNPQMINLDLEQV